MTTSTWLGQKFSNILVCVRLWCVCHVTEAVQAVEEISAMISGIVVVGALKLYALVRSVWGFKAVQMNVQHFAPVAQSSMIWQGQVGLKPKILRPRFKRLMAQSAGAAEYTDCISADGQNSTNVYPGNHTKQSDGEAPVILEL